MTYSNAADWADRNIPKDDFDTFDDWLQFAVVDSDNGLQTPALLSEPEFIDFMRRYWLDEVGALDRFEEEIDDDRIEPPISEDISIPSVDRKDIQIDSGFIVTSKGVEPVKVLDMKTDDSPPIVITESQATAQKLPEPQRERLAQNIPRPQIGNRISNVATRIRGIATDILGFLRRKK